MNYKLVAITFKNINQAIKFIAQENYKWVEVGGDSHQIIENINTTTVTVVFAKSVETEIETVSQFIDKIKSKPKRECLVEIIVNYYPHIANHNQQSLKDKRVPLSVLQTKEFLRDKVDDLAYKVPNGKDKDAWHNSLFMVKVSMECQGVKFWRAATDVIKWLKEQNQLVQVA